jgi:hypothetical protein
LPVITFITINHFYSPSLGFTPDEVPQASSAYAVIRITLFRTSRLSADDRRGAVRLFAFSTIFVRFCSFLSFSGQIRRQ